MELGREDLEMGPTTVRWPTFTSGDVLTRTSYRRVWRSAVSQPVSNAARFYLYRAVSARIYCWGTLRYRCKGISAAPTIRLLFFS
jgi:hypothetical protein